VGGITFKQPGAYAYMCKEHPWAVGEIIVED
jgi:plastocyanin